MRRRRPRHQWGAVCRTCHASIDVHSDAPAAIDTIAATWWRLHRHGTEDDHG